MLHDNVSYLFLEQAEKKSFATTVSFPRPKLKGETVEQSKK